MNDKLKLLPVMLTLILIILMNQLFEDTCIAETMEPVGAMNPNMPVSPEIKQALDTAYLAAQEAGMINVAAETKIRTDSLNGIGGSEQQPSKGTRDPVGQMVAFGLGAGAGWLVVNYLGGSAAIGSFNAFSAITFGGMMGDYVYRKHYAPPLPNVPAGVAGRISP